jgi:transposase, IS5 family
LAKNGLKVNWETIVDATLISAPSSTKNEQKTRDPEMRQTKKGNQWYFRMKSHIGVDSQTKLIHSMATTSANVHISVMLPKLLHGKETRVWGDAAYTGQGEVIRQQDPFAKDLTRRKGFRHRELAEAERARNKNKSRIRAKVEYLFLVIKSVFGFVKVRYRNLMKNTNWLYVICGSTNFYMARRKLLSATSERGTEMVKGTTKNGIQTREHPFIHYFECLFPHNLKTHINLL